MGTSSILKITQETAPQKEKTEGKMFLFLLTVAWQLEIAFPGKVRERLFKKVISWH